jgi:ketosteroid isomerase-like protein
MADDHDEVRATLDAYLELRRAIDAGEATWSDLGRFYTDDAVYIDPAWGRVEGLDAIVEFFEESMRGLEDWRFPIEAAAVDGDEVLVKWTQVLPSGKCQTGVSSMRYAGDGRFDHQEDLLNMVHVLADLEADGWRPGPGFVMPPAAPNRDVSRPAPVRAAAREGR